MKTIQVDKLKNSILVDFNEHFSRCHDTDQEDLIDMVINCIDELAEEPITNGDKIRSMSDEELAEWIHSHDIKSAMKGFFTERQTINWLKQEVSE